MSLLKLGFELVDDYSYRVRLTTHLFVDEQDEVVDFFVAHQHGLPSLNRHLMPVLFNVETDFMALAKHSIRR